MVPLLFVGSSSFIQALHIEYCPKKGIDSSFRSTYVPCVFVMLISRKKTELASYSSLSLLFGRSPWLFSDFLRPYIESWNIYIRCYHDLASYVAVSPSLFGFVWKEFLPNLVVLVPLCYQSETQPGIETGIPSVIRTSTVGSQLCPSVTSWRPAGWESDVVKPITLSVPNHESWMIRLIQSLFFDRNYIYIYDSMTIMDQQRPLMSYNVMEGDNVQPWAQPIGPRLTATVHLVSFEEPRFVWSQFTEMVPICFRDPLHLTGEYVSHEECKICHQDTIIQMVLKHIPIYFALVCLFHMKVSRYPIEMRFRTHGKQILTW